MAKKRRAPLTVPSLPYLKKYRHRARLTQDQLTAILELSQGLISQWETGKTDILLSDVPKIAKAVKTTAYELMFVDPDSPDANIFAVWNRVPPGQRRQALRILEAIANPAE